MTPCPLAGRRLNPCLPNGHGRQFLYPVFRLHPKAAVVVDDGNLSGSSGALWCWTMILSTMPLSHESL